MSSIVFCGDNQQLINLNHNNTLPLFGFMSPNLQNNGEERAQHTRRYSQDSGTA